MKTTITFLLLFTLCLSARAGWPMPAEVLVATDEIPAKEFTIWEESDPMKYQGSFSGDVGGDSTGQLTLKVTPGKADGILFFASGSYTMTVAGETPIVVKFENASYYGDPKGVFNAGAFRIIFVRYGKISGVIVGENFIPKVK